jgi:hypothetical protein
VHDLDDPALARLTREARYDTLIGLAAANLRTGRPVVLVAPFSTERADPSAWATTTRRLEAEPTLVWLHLLPDELIRRLARRLCCAALPPAGQMRALPLPGQPGSRCGAGRRNSLRRAGSLSV